jgi:gliding motility-associated-like protein
VTQTTYVVTGTFSTTGCSSSANAIVKVNPLPTGNLLVTGTQNVCANAQRTFQVNAGQANTGFQWLLNGQVISGATSRSITTRNEGTYTVELTSVFGCKAIATGSVDLVQIIKAEADFDAPIVCIGKSTTFQNSSNISRSGVVRWEWDFGDGTGSTTENPVKKYTLSGTYKVTLRAYSQTCPGLNDTIEKFVIVKDPLPGIRYPTIEGLINTNIPLKARNIGNIFLWNPSVGLNNPAIIDPIFRYDRDTEYLIRITSQIGCETVDTILLRLHSNADVFVPEAFSPNGDGINDLLDVYLQGVRKIHFWVFNRWGQLMFETNDPKQRWDGNFKGKPQPLENYVWIAELETFTGQRIKKRGQTILIR